MTQKVKVAIGAAAFLVMIAGATAAYNMLQANTEIMLAEQPASISAPGSENEPASQNGDAEQESEKIKALDFTVEDFDGNSVKLSDMEGKPVVLNFWASWCPPCKAEMPDFEQVYTELGDEVTFMMVNMTDGQRETKEHGSAYISDQNFSFPVYYDIAQEASNTYGVRSIPTTIFIDSNGYIITGAEGQLNEKSLRYGISLIQAEADEIIE